MVRTPRIVASQQKLELPLLCHIPLLHHCDILCLLMFDVLRHEITTSVVLQWRSGGEAISICGRRRRQGKRRTMMW
jgi:hypothetical protein